MATRIRFDEIPSFLEKNSVATSTVRQVLKNLRENCQKYGKVTDEDILALNSFFDEILEKALEIVEGNKITYFHTNSHVGIYQVEGSSNRTYTIFPSVNYCSCASYKYQVSSGSQITCKHVLATVIANATGAQNSVEGTKMNDREDWQNRNPYFGQFMPSNPLPTVSPAFGIPTNNWVHVPPQIMPWGTPPEAQPAVVRFTAGDFNPHVVPVKRKCESDIEILPAKMLVTEEKMAAHMRGLHISDLETPEDVSSVSCKEEPMEADRMPKLVISDEIKNLKTESIIPESILKKLEKPEMALVLWQPPPTDLDGKLRELKKLSVLRKKEKEKEKEKEMECREETEMDIAIETETENNSLNSVFRPIDPVPMPSFQNQFFQPVPQFHGFGPFPSQNNPQS